MAERRCLLTVHAHPDDESSKGAATVARYHDQGVHTVLVCCTGGEEGDILNPAMDRPEVKENMAEYRRNELKAATDIIGYDEVVMLGYRDSGMPDSEANKNPDSFAMAPLYEAVGRLVEIIRRVKPQVIVDLPRGADPLPAPRPPSGARDLGDRVRRGGRPRGLPGRWASPTRRRSCTTRSGRWPGCGPSTRSSWSSAWSRRSATSASSGCSRRPRSRVHHGDRRHRLRRRADRGPAGARHPGRPHLAHVVRAAARGPEGAPDHRGLPAGARAGSGPSR